MLTLNCCLSLGIFVALALRFDVSRGKGNQYFKSAFLGYTTGLVVTIVVMNWFQAAQVTTTKSISLSYMTDTCGDIVPFVEFHSVSSWL